MGEVTISIRNNKIVVNKKSPEYILLGKFGDEYKVISTHNNICYMVDDLNKQLADIRTKRKKNE